MHQKLNDPMFTFDLKVNFNLIFIFVNHILKRDKKMIFGLDLDL